MKHTNTLNQCANQIWCPCYWKLSNLKQWGKFDSVWVPIYLLLVPLFTTGTRKIAFRLDYGKGKHPTYSIRQLHTQRKMKWMLRLGEMEEIDYCLINPAFPWTRCRHSRDSLGFGYTTIHVLPQWRVAEQAVLLASNLLNLKEKDAA